MGENRSLFDIVGPIMIGPSSSHTAGAVRLGSLARAVLGETPTRAEIVLHGSFASTGSGHGTKLALVAGLLGFEADDERLVDSFTHARDNGLAFEFFAEDLGEVHPNTTLFKLWDAAGQMSVVRGSSVGGGAVVVDRINNYHVNLSGEYPTLVVAHKDRPGKISIISGIIAESRINIASMNVSRERKGDDALMILEVDEPVDSVTIRRILKQVEVQEVRQIPKI